MLKHERIHSKVGADLLFLLKISCLNFSKAVVCDANPDPDPWVRIRKKIHLKVGADPSFLSKISCLKFSKAVRCDANPDPDPWVRIRKKFIKTENANDSGSGRGPDPRIVPN